MILAIVTVAGFFVLFAFQYERMQAQEGESGSSKRIGRTGGRLSSVSGSEADNAPEGS